MATSYTVLLVFIFISIFAYLKEKEDQANCYRIAKPAEKDTIKQIVKKINETISYDTKSIKWRRALICSIISVFVIFALVETRIPQIREFILYLIVIYVVQYVSWKNYNKVISYPAKKYGELNLDKLINTF